MVTITSYRGEYTASTKTIVSTATASSVAMTTTPSAVVETTPSTLKSATIVPTAISMYVAKYVNLRKYISY